MTPRLFLLAVLAAVPGCGCDGERKRLEEELDGLTRHRQLLQLHQANLRVAADAEIAGRPLEALPPDAQARLTDLQLQYYRAETEVRVVDGRIENVRDRLNGTYEDASSR